MPLNILTVRGNHERQLLEQDFSDMSLSDRHAFKSLQATHWKWLKNLPAQLTFNEDILMVHGVRAMTLFTFLKRSLLQACSPRLKRAF